MNSLFERVFGLTLLDPWFLLLALLVLAAPVIQRVRGKGRPALPLAPVSLLDVPRTWRITLLPLPRVLFVLGLLCVVVALARPAARESLPSRHEGIDILLCLDTSSSMTAKDMDARRSRLDVARAAAVRFIRRRPNDRIGLIHFARYADVACPLTLDHDAVETILADLVTVASDGPEDATGIGTAVARAAQVLDQTGATSKVVILLTDGEENVATAGAKGEIAPTHAAQLCGTLGVRVYAIVAGTGRADPSGNWQTPDTRSVERLANTTGGVFLEARNAAAMNRVYATIDRLERVPFEEPRTVYRDRHLAFLITALLLILGSLALDTTVLEVLP